MDVLTVDLYSGMLACTVLISCSTLCLQRPFVVVVDRPEDDVIHTHIYIHTYIDVKEVRSLVRGTLVMSTDRSFLEPQKLLRRISV